MSTKKDLGHTDSEIDLVVEVRGVEQGNRPVSVSFPAVSVKQADGTGEDFVKFEGPYDVYSPPGSKGIDMAVEAPIFLGLLAHIFSPAENLCEPTKGKITPSIWALSGFDMTLTVTTRFYGYKKGSSRSLAQVGLSQLTGTMKGSPFGGTYVGRNDHFWHAPDFALKFQDSKVSISPAGYGRFAISANYSWNQGEWTAKTRGFLILNGNPMHIGHPGAVLNTALEITIEENKTDNADGKLSGKVKGKIVKSNEGTTSSELPVKGKEVASDFA
jgi:hypothetical protein